MSTARIKHTATLLPNGQVLAVGGVNSTGFLTSTELYDTTTGKWTNSRSMTTAREQHTAVGPAKTGMRDLQKLVNVPGNWILSTAVGVSADGTVITGYGLNPKLVWEPFRIVLPLQ